MGGMVDEPLPSGAAAQVADLLGVPYAARARSSLDLRGDAGRFWTGRDERTGLPIPGQQRRFFVDQAQPAEKGARVFEHELGHVLEDFMADHAIPTTGVVKVLRSVYEQLNTPGNFRSGRGAKFRSLGYAHRPERPPDAVTNSGRSRKRLPIAMCLS